jgi:hypothetical protein
MALYQASGRMNFDLNAMASGCGHGDALTLSSDLV